ncbi:ROK family protein [Aureitalea sp. L0-47]|uniref:ROK family protein n=1 Tax=Aureitalea sp. L0-47 TaxID=2816962 RepID=UPI0022370C22|nr:ROK family protein [Aureitalea sp. L0-47]MCW5520446.1 ROK family protein [Aureitalea sp. L0-47]
MNAEYIGVDLGGTTFNAGLVHSGMLLEETSRKIVSNASSETILTVLTDAIEEILTEDVKGIGVGVPGIVDPQNGMIYNIQNIPAWQEVPLQQILQEEFKVPVVLNNDANCFALGEKQFGKGKEFSDFIGLSIGTGLGMGVIINNSLYSGVLCGAGEIGMLPYKEGLVEEYTGSFFFIREYGISAKEMHKEALNGDRKAIRAFEEFGTHLGEAIKMILFMYAPQAIIMGGSIAKAQQFFESSMHESIRKFAYPKQIEQLKILTSSHPNLPILGASALCL